MQHPNDIQVGRLSAEDEIANSVTHGIGLGLSLAGAAALMIVATGRGDSWHVAGCAIYVVTMVAVYAASTLSHIFQRPRLRRLFRILDQAFIYLFIAGTFTPVALTYLRGGWWWLLLGSMWGVALFGFLSKVLFSHRVEGVSTALYVLMGWLPASAVKPIVAAVPSPVLWWMLAGGICYTVGVLFLRLDERIRYFHAIWHLLVIAGSACHYVAILCYVVPEA